MTGKLLRFLNRNPLTPTCSQLVQFRRYSFVKELIKSGELDYQRPVMDKYKNENKPIDVISSSLISAQVRESYQK